MNEGDVAAAGKLPLLPLHTLGFQGFQDLCGTILGEVLGQTSAVWAPTNDAGRDGAFVGRWTPGPNEVYEGHFVVQAKHTSAQGAPLTISIFEDELAKVSALVAGGRADIYVLMTNHRVTSRLELQLVEGLRQRGIEHVLILGDHWISKQVYESSRLRALVPRVYGIGDLGEVIDARAYQQACAVLASYQDEIRTFVPTDAYHRALRALEEHRFVVLVGEPGSGKSTIAAVLAWLAADQWKLSPIVVADPRRFEPHWNPDRVDQLFWADDAFGPIQYDSARAIEWRQLARELRAAVKRGTRFILTTRDYIFHEARDVFRASDLPVADVSQVVIGVEELSLEEKEAILYNHIKLGDQPQSFRRRVKAFLPAVAARTRMLPEVARRLASPLFTDGLQLTPDGLDAFASDPKRYLLEVLKELSREHRGVLVFLLAKGGLVHTPIDLDSADYSILLSIGTSLSDLRAGLSALKGTFVRFVDDERTPYWTYRHPTIHEAISTYVAQDPELVGLYIRGARIDQILAEVYFSHWHRPPNAQITVPRHLYKMLAQRLAEHINNTEDLESNVTSFLAERADQQFFEALVATGIPLVSRLMSFRCPLDRNRELSILSSLDDIGTLTGTEKQAIVERIGQLAIEKPDAGWLESSLVVGTDRDRLLAAVRDALDGSLRYIVDTWEQDWPSDEEPRSFFAPLEQCFEDYAREFKHMGDRDAEWRFRSLSGDVSYVLDRLDERYQVDHLVPQQRLPVRKPARPITRSRFDDLDE